MIKNIRDTSIKCYDEIKKEGIYDTDMEEVYDAIKRYPLMTGREYAQIVLGYNDMNKVRPRISDLKNKDYIIDIGKRECTCSKRTSYVWATLEGAEKIALKKSGFIENKPELLSCEEDGAVCFQDFRKGKRRSYAFAESGESIAYNKLECYNKFKEELKQLLSKEE